MRNTEEVKLKNREILQNENKDKEEEFIEKFIEKVEQNKKNNNWRLTNENNGK